MPTIYTSPLPPVTIPEEAVTPVVFRHAERLADRPAVIDGPTGRVTTYRELHDAVNRFAGALAARGIGKGDVLAIMAPNLAEYAVAFHGTNTVGAAVTTINPTYTAEEVEFQLNDAGARLLVTVPEIMDEARRAVAGSGVTEIVVIGEAQGATPFASLLTHEPVSGQTPIRPRTDLAALPYSSGTTGLPKGVMLTHHNLVANLAQLEHSLTMGSDDRVIAVLPFFHIYGMQVLMNGVLYFGGTAVTMPRFDLEQFLGLLQEHRITQAYLVPPIILALAKHPLVDSYDLGALERVVSGAAPLGSELAEEAAQRVGAEVVQGYGLTETSPVTHATPPGRYKAGSIGITISNTECRVVHPETGDDLDRNQDGEIWIRGPQVIAGYLNKPQATAITIDDDGWLHTGDIGHIDDDDHFYIVDRLKELIKYKGFQVPPAELEAVLLTHPDVADAAVIPIPDLEAGELPKAFVVRKPGRATTEDEIMTFVAGHVARYKRIRELEFLDEIPKSASGKILRRVLRDRRAGA
jgi:acyl-CoA synthetase (AMP-forming)/AMP-acid ligase II